MTRTVIDLDDDLLAAASKILGATTKRETVNLALGEIVRRRQRADLIDWLASDPLPDLRDPEVMRQAWPQ